MLELWLLAAVRMLALCFTAPLLGARIVPISIRLATGIALSIVVMPMLQSGGVAVHPFENSGRDLFRCVLAEATVGVMLGLAVSSLILLAQWFGQLAGQMAGFHWADNEDASDAETPLARLTGFLALAIFILIGGVELMIAAILDSLQTLPIGNYSISTEASIGFVCEMLRQSVWLSVRCVGPLVAVILATHLLLGVMSRLAPQLGLFQAGLNVNLIAFWLALILVVSGSFWLFQNEVDELFQTISRRLTQFDPRWLETAQSDFGNKLTRGRP